MKVAVAQIGTDPGCFDYNIEKIIRAIKQAKTEGVKLLVFPEGAIQGYAHLDLVFSQTFLEATQAALQRIAASTEGITIIIGFVDFPSTATGPDGNPVIHNSAAVIQNGSIIAVRDKTLLPEYDIFSEYRYFTPGTRTGLVTIDDLQVGIGICEDLWATGYRTQVYPALIEAGADLLVNISASPFHAGKQQDRIHVIKDLILGKNVAFIYANLVGSYDGYDGEIVFDGQSMIWNADGNLVGVAPAFTEQLHCVELNNAPIVSYAPASETAEMYNALVFGIQEYFRRTGFARAFIGLSGGIDSALVACLCVTALGKDAVVGITMPSHVTSEETCADAHTLAKNLGIQIEERSIVSEFNAWRMQAESAHPQGVNSLTLQNKQARIRGAILMEYSNQYPSSIVVSTGNKTELALGYCTLYGDMCGGFAAISDVSKERVYALSEYYNALTGFACIPQSTLDRTPTAELEVGQTDAANLPADYDILSPLVDAIVDAKQSRSELLKKFDATVVDKTMRLIRVNEFKRRQAAPGIRVTRKAFGIGRRIPMIHCFTD